jgi:hypothetical protein
MLIVAFVQLEILISYFNAVTIALMKNYQSIFKIFIKKIKNISSPGEYASENKSRKTCNLAI